MLKIRIITDHVPIAVVGDVTYELQNPEGGYEPPDGATWYQLMPTTVTRYNDSTVEVMRAMVWEEADPE